MTGRKIEHGAQYHPSIIAKLGEIIPRGTRVHDCYAGTGERLGEGSDLYGWIFTGVEIEAPLIIDPRVVPGDATDPTTYPTLDHWNVCSPVYANGMTDAFPWKPPEEYAKPSTYNTYRHWLARTLGYDRPLHPNNMGGTSARTKKGKAIFDQLARDSVACWTASTVIVNMKDRIADGEVVDLVGEWVDLLGEYGYIVTERVKVPCPGNRRGRNGELRVEHEELIIAERIGPLGIGRC